MPTALQKLIFNILGSLQLNYNSPIKGQYGSENYNVMVEIKGLFNIKECWLEVHSEHGMRFLLFDVFANYKHKLQRKCERSSSIVG